MHVSATCYHASQQVEERDLLAETQGCPLCGGLARERAARLQRSPVVWLLRCVDCRGAGAHRMPTQSRLDRYYESYYAPGSDTPHVTLSSPARAARHIDGLVAKSARTEGTSILDFGGGDGSVSVHLAGLLLGRRRSKHTAITIIDRASQALPQSSPTVTLRTARSLDDLGVGGTYDIIIASAVLEHLPTPVPVLAQLLSLLSRGGRLYVRTPWVAPLMSALSPVGIHVDFTYPGHLYDLGGDFWERALLLPGIPGHLAFRLDHSAPSFVETAISQAPVRTLAAILLKAPARLLGTAWPWVGGWEVVFVRDA